MANIYYYSPCVLDVVIVILWSVYKQRSPEISHSYKLNCPPWILEAHIEIVLDYGQLPLACSPSLPPSLPPGKVGIFNPVYIYQSHNQHSFTFVYRSLKKKYFPTDLWFTPAKEFKWARRMWCYIYSNRPCLRACHSSDHSPVGRWLLLSILIGRLFIQPQHCSDQWNHEAACRLT